MIHVRLTLTILIFGFTVRAPEGLDSTNIQLGSAIFMT